jgi:ribonuclease P/MRP protein subunit POP1
MMSHHRAANQKLAIQHRHNKVTAATMTNAPKAILNTHQMMHVSFTPIASTAVLIAGRPAERRIEKMHKRSSPGADGHKYGTSKEALISHRTNTPSSTGKRTSVGSGNAKRKSSSWFSDEDTSAQHTPAIRSDKFLNARIQELIAIAESVPIQTLGNSSSARSLRRRAGSFRSYRLPLIIRARPCKKPKVAIGLSYVKYPCRAQRRFRRQLVVQSGGLSTHARGSKSIWLETHLWHCKRMHMVDCWGYVLADRRCDTGIRAAGRWTRTQCTLHDASYTCCIQLCGPGPHLLKILRSSLGSNSLSLSPAFDESSGIGGREVEVMLHRPGMYPLGAISPVRIIWRPISHQLESKSIDSHIRTVWLWLHPAARSDALEILKSLASLPDTSQPSRPTSRSAGKDSVTVDDISKELLRFELRGPCADAILRSVVCPLAEDRTEQHDTSAFWRDNQSPSTAMRLLPGQSIMVRCHDPRLLFPLPQHRALAARNQTTPLPGRSAVSDKPWLLSTHMLPPSAWSQALADGPLWDATGRASLDGRRAESVAGVNARRSRGLLQPVRTAENVLEGRLESLCVMLVRVEVAAGDLASSGWDVVLPCGWGATMFQQVCP